MAVPRPILLAVIGVVLLVATFMATRGSSEKTSSSSAPAAKAPAPAAPSPSQAAAPAAKPSKTASQPKTQSSSAQASKTKAHGKSAKAPARRASSASPAAVERALARHRVVVLAFFQPGADDRATRSAVQALSRRHVATVFTERIGRIGRYRSIVGSLGVNQAPAVVIVDQKRHARVVEGYVDAETLAQEVADARG